MLELLHRFSRRGPKPAAAALVPVVFEEAAEGDEVARAIIETDASRFADAVRTTAFQLGLEAPYALVLAGGVLRHPQAVLCTPTRSRASCPMRSPCGRTGSRPSARCCWPATRSGVEPDPDTLRDVAAVGHVLRHALRPVARTEGVPLPERAPQYVSDSGPETPGALDGRVVAVPPGGGEATVVADGFDYANGLALAPDGTLYVVESYDTPGVTALSLADGSRRRDRRPTGDRPGRASRCATTVRCWCAASSRTRSTGSRPAASPSWCSTTGAASRR